MTFEKIKLNQWKKKQIWESGYEKISKALGDENNDGKSTSKTDVTEMNSQNWSETEKDIVWPESNSHETCFKFRKPF